MSNSTIRLLLRDICKTVLSNLEEILEIDFPSPASASKEVILCFAAFYNILKFRCIFSILHYSTALYNPLLYYTILYSRILYSIL